MNVAVCGCVPREAARVLALGEIARLRPVAEPRARAGGAPVP